MEGHRMPRVQPRVKPAVLLQPALSTYTRLVTGILAVSGQWCGLSVKGLAEWV